MKKLLAFPLLPLLLVACNFNNIHDPSNLPPGTQVHLNQTIKFASSQVVLYFQYGKIVPANYIDDYRPNCSLEVKHKLAHPQSFHTDTFRIVKVRYNISGSGHTGHSYASLFAGPTHYPEYSTAIFLHSADQPNLYILTCQHLEDPDNARYLNLNEIQEALGNIITISQPR